MPMAPKGTSSSRKPPEPSDSHAEIDEWMQRNVMPDLQPLVQRLDELIRKGLSKPQFALKWKKAYYGLPEQGWVIEMVAYDVSVNVVFLFGAEFDSPPPLGESGQSRYIKLKSLDDLDEAAFKKWIKQAAKGPGWK